MKHKLFVLLLLISLLPLSASAQIEADIPAGVVTWQLPATLSGSYTEAWRVLLC